MGSKWCHPSLPFSYSFDDFSFHPFANLVHQQNPPCIPGLRNILKSQAVQKKCCDYLVIYITNTAVRGQGVKSALNGHLGSKPHLKGLLRCLTFLAARKSFFIFYLNNSYCNFSPTFLSLFTVAARTGLSASSDLIIFVIKSAITLSFLSLLRPVLNDSFPQFQV